MKLISILTNGSAVLCVGAIPLWILGIPGTENNYAKGWKMGFAVLYLYPAFILALRTVGFLTSRFAFPEPVRAAQWENGVALTAGLVAAGRLIQAFKTMD